MDTLELFFRFAGTAQLVVLAAVLIKDHRDKISALLIAAWALSGACHLIVVPAIRDWHWGTVSYLLMIGSVSWTVLFWLVSKSLFQDNFKLLWRHLLVLILVVFASLASGGLAFGSGFSAILMDPTEIVVLQILSLVFIVLALAVTLKDWRNDLVESRRRARLVLLVATGLYALVIGLAVFIFLNVPTLISVRVLDTSHAGFICALCFCVSIAWYSVHTQSVAPSISHPPPTTSPSEDVEPTKAELKRLIQEQHVYSEHGLTISRLAEMLYIKEYKLRRIINGEFGYRNFNDFLNQHRIAEAAQRLIAPETRRLPVLTIALDVGYSSLGPFNRAFRQQFDMTPTEFRATSNSRKNVSPATDRGSD